MIHLEWAGVQHAVTLPSSDLPRNREAVRAAIESQHEAYFATQTNDGAYDLVWYDRYLRKLRRDERWMVAPVIVRVVQSRETTVSLDSAVLQALLKAVTAGSLTTLQALLEQFREDANNSDLVVYTAGAHSSEGIIADVSRRPDVDEYGRAVLPLGMIQCQFSREEERRWYLPLLKKSVTSTDFVVAVHTAVRLFD